MNFRVLLAIVLVVWPVSGWPQCEGIACSNVDVERIYIRSSGIVYVGTSGDERGLNCSPVSEVYTTLDLSEVGAQAIYSALLSAQMAGKKVKIRISEGASKCDILYVVLDKQ